jgi:phospholipase C
VTDRDPISGPLTRRDVVRAGGGLALASMFPMASRLASTAWGMSARGPDSLPDPSRPAGEPADHLPFDHLIVVMMENHSFDNYFGMLPRQGKRQADGFDFGPHGHPVNRNPLHGGYVLPKHAKSRCQPLDITQSWNATHEQINGGRMNGFARTTEGAMLYWREDDIPFYYSLAKKFTLANRWFSSAPCQTFPNRRFLLAGTAYGLISTDTSSVLDPPPPNGTIFDRLAAEKIDWRDYYTDLPGVGVIGSVVKKYPEKLAPISQFYADCASGRLPAVSFVDPEFGLTNDVGAALSGVPGIPIITNPGETQGGDEENPQDISIGENFVAKVVNAVMRSPAWGRSLLVWLYDEHGGYYDHVPPPRAVKPDNIKPELGPDDVPGGYDIYGPRVPAVVVSPHARKHAVTNAVHDHTSVLATIEHKWNLPACTRRDANARTLEGFLHRHKAPFAEPPKLAKPGDLAESERTCSTEDPTLKVHHRHHHHQ